MWYPDKSPSFFILILFFHQGVIATSDVMKALLVAARKE